MCRRKTSALIIVYYGFTSCKQDFLDLRNRASYTFIEIEQSRGTCMEKVLNVKAISVFLTIIIAIYLTGCATTTNGISAAGEFNVTVLHELASIQDIREYQTTYGRMRIGFDGVTAKGVYTYRQGTIRGNLQGNVLSGVWMEGSSGGTFTFYFSPDFASFQGYWAPGNHEWKGTLIQGNRGVPGIASTPSPASASMSPTRQSDVDQIPLIRTQTNRNAYAIVIGIERYRQKLPKADFATQDAKIVAAYLNKAMGYPEENIVILTNENATKSDFEKYFEQWLANHAEKESTIFVYYSGHGAPNPKTGDAYLVPYDGDPSFIAQTGYSLKRLYETLGKLPSKEIIVALDSCFSGAGGRSVLAKGARPLVLNLEANTALPKNMTVMSASSGEQISSTYDEKGHGLFTYFLLKGIKNEDVVKQDGSIAVSDLFSYIKPQVQRIARRQYNNEQTPQLIGGKP